MFRISRQFLIAKSQLRSPIEERMYVNTLFKSMRNFKVGVFVTRSLSARYFGGYHFRSHGKAISDLGQILKRNTKSTHTLFFLVTKVKREENN